MHCSLLFCFSSCCYSSTKTITITILEIDLISTGVTETLSKTTAWRHRKKKFEEEQTAAAKAEGLPTSKKVRMAYTCRKCKQPMSKENGHSQYFGQTYCPNEPGQIPREEWLAKKAEEWKAKKTASS